MLDRINWKVFGLALAAFASTFVAGAIALQQSGTVENVGAALLGTAGFGLLVTAWRAAKPIVTADPDHDGIPAIVDRDEGAP